MHARGKLSGIAAVVSAAAMALLSLTAAPALAASVVPPPPGKAAQATPSRAKPPVKPRVGHAIAPEKTPALRSMPLIRPPKAAPKSTAPAAQPKVTPAAPKSGSGGSAAAPKKGAGASAAPAKGKQKQAAPKNAAPKNAAPPVTPDSARAAPDLAGQTATSDIQTSNPLDDMPPFTQNFDGQNILGTQNGSTYFQTEENSGAVGANDYVQEPHSGTFAVYSKQGTLLFGPAAISTLWQDFSGPCHNAGGTFAGALSAAFVYDQLAGRWLVSTDTRADNDNYDRCIAVSQTSDPLGSWNLYAFPFNEPDEAWLAGGGNIGVWPDAYYLSDDLSLYNNSNNQGATPVPNGELVVAFDRAAMLAGQPAPEVSFTLGSQYRYLRPTTDTGGAQGQNPPAGAPDPFFMSCPPGAVTTNHVACAQLDEWDFHVSWTTPSSSTFGSNLAPSKVIPVDQFDSNLCDYGNCIQQPGDTAGNAGSGANSGGLSGPAAYRDLNGTQALVLAQTVNVSPDPSTGNQAGIRWYELTNTGSGWGVGQQGTYAPDSSSRWVGAASIDASGDIALAYSVTGSSVYASAAVAGRLAGDPPGQLTQGEQIAAAGGGTAGGNSGWGTSLQADAADGCTFWFNAGYVTAADNLTARIGSFMFPGCTTGAHGQISGTVTDAGTGQPVAGAQVATADGTTVADGQGHYTLVLPAGSYDLTASAWLHNGATVSGAQVTGGGTTTENIALTVAPAVTVSGTVTDGSGHGYPLYARIDIPGLPGGSVWTNPATGQYSVSLPQNQTFTATVTPTLAGYQPVTQQIAVGTGNQTQNVALQVDPATCTASGYALQDAGPPVLSENFDDYAGDGGTTPPPGWTIQDNAGDGQVWTFNDPQELGNQTGGSGFFADINSRQFGSDGYQDSALVTPVFSLAGGSRPVLQFNNDFETTETAAIADVDVSTDGGLSWTNVWEQQGSSVAGPGLQTIPLDQFAGDTSVQVEFHYWNGFNDKWWQIDNVTVSFRGCEPVPGGLLVGKVTDANTGAGVADAPVGLADPPALSETFDDFAGDGGTTPPPGWTIQDNKGNGEVWSFNDPSDSVLPINYGNLTGGTGYYAGVNSFAFRPGDSQDTSLISPVFSAASDDDPVLTFSTVFDGSDNSTGEVDLSTDGGQTWASIWNGGNEVDGPDVETVPLPQAAGQSSVRLRFHYTGALTANDSSAGAWQVDNVTVGRAAIQAATASVPLTQGPAVPVGYYQVFDQVTGSHSYSAAEAGYVSSAQTVNVATDAVTEADFTLTAPQLSVSTQAITSGQALGSTTTHTLTITNTGTAPATVSVDQRSGLSQVLSQQGAPLNLVKPAQPFSLGTPASSTAKGSGKAAAAPAATVPGGAWSPIASYPIPIDQNATAAGDGLIYSVGGQSENLSSGTLPVVDNAYAYNPSTDSWKAITSLPQPLLGPSAAFVNGKLYVAGGGSGLGPVTPGPAYSYDPQTNRWSSLPAKPHAAFGGAAAVVGSTIYFIGGCTGSCAATASVDAYNTATSTWSEVAPYPQAVAYTACGAISGKIYCAGGVNDNLGGITPSAAGYVYDPVANTWSPIAALPATVWASADDAASGLLVLSGGVFNGFISNQALAYDPTTNTWTSLPDSYYTMYQTAGACGFYQVGGDNGGRGESPQVDAQRLPGLNGCASTSLPWLGVAGGQSVTLAPGHAATVTVTLAATAAAKITQPGTFSAQLGLENNTPYNAAPVNVTMTVTAPAGWGEVTGTVTGKNCSGTSGPVANAQIQAIGKNTSVNATAGSDGTYALWAPAAGNPYQVVAKMSGWAPKLTVVTIKAGGTVTANFTLSPLC